MAYYPDLSKSGSDQKTFAIGWLDRLHVFEKARPPQWLVERLWSYCEYSLTEARGYHDCNIPNCSGPARKFRHLRPAQKARLLRYLYKRLEARRVLLAKVKAKFPKHHATLFTNFNSMIEQEIMSAERGYSRIILGINPDTHKRMELGYAEIRVFGKSGKIYAAPNMLYHYVTVHHYKPPNEFLQAVKNYPPPPAPEYLSRLQALGLSLSVIQAYRRSQQEGENLMKRPKERLFK